MLISCSDKNLYKYVIVDKNSSPLTWKISLSLITTSFVNIAYWIILRMIKKCNKLWKDYENFSQFYTFEKISNNQSHGEKKLLFVLLLCCFVQDRAQTSVAQPIFIFKSSSNKPVRVIRTFIIRWIAFRCNEIT